MKVVIIMIIQILFDDYTYSNTTCTVLKMASRPVYCLIERGMVGLWSHENHMLSFKMTNIYMHFQVSTPTGQPGWFCRPQRQAVEAEVVPGFPTSPIPGAVPSRWTCHCGWEHGEIQGPTGFPTVPPIETHKVGGQGLGHVREHNWILCKLPGEKINPAH